MLLCEHVSALLQEGMLLSPRSWADGVYAEAHVSAVSAAVFLEGAVPAALTADGRGRVVFHNVGAHLSIMGAVSHLSPCSSPLFPPLPPPRGTGQHFIIAHSTKAPVRLMHPNWHLANRWILVAKPPSHSASCHTQAVLQRSAVSPTIPAGHDV